MSYNSNSNFLNSATNFWSNKLNYSSNSSNISPQIPISTQIHQTNQSYSVSPIQFPNSQNPISFPTSNSQNFKNNIPIRHAHNLQININQNQNPQNSIPFRPFNNLNPNENIYPQNNLFSFHDNMDSSLFNAINKANNYWQNWNGWQNQSNNNNNNFNLYNQNAVPQKIYSFENIITSIDEGISTEKSFQKLGEKKIKPKRKYNKKIQKNSKINKTQTHSISSKKSDRPDSVNIAKKLLAITKNWDEVCKKLPEETQIIFKEKMKKYLKRKILPDLQLKNKIQNLFEDQEHNIQKNNENNYKMDMQDFCTEELLESNFPLKSPAYQLESPETPRDILLLNSGGVNFDKTPTPLPITGELVFGFHDEEYEVNNRKNDDQMIDEMIRRN